MAFVIGGNGTPLEVAHSEASQALASFISACRHHLWLRVPSLDTLTADQQVCQSIKELALANARADIRVLFDELDYAVHNGHRLVHLARRLPSRLQLRQTRIDDRDPQVCHGLGENNALFEASGWPRPARIQLLACQPSRAARLSRDFREVWERANSSLEIRELRL